MPEAVTQLLGEYGKYASVIAGVLVFLALALLRNKLASLLLGLAGRVIYAKKPEKRQGFVQSLKRPLALYFVVLGVYLGVIINYRHTAITGAFKIISILFVCRLLIGFASDNVELLLGAKSKDPQVNGIAVKFISNILKVLTVCVAVVMVLSELGYNINGLLTGLGVGGLAVSLAAQDSIKSIISGFVLMIDRPFDVGDFIETKEFSGTVEDITMRSTRIRKLDDTVLTVPNTIIADDLITNYAKLNKRLVEMQIGLVYSTDNETLERCMDRIRGIIESEPKAEKNGVRVRFVEFDDSALNIEIRFYVAITPLEEYYEFLSGFNLKVKQAVEESGADFAFPSRSVYIESSGGKEE